MVNVGKRSKCCFMCRKRRIKCDLQLPQCHRCQQIGRTCPGYPEAWDVAFRLQNHYAKNKVQKRVNRVRAERMGLPGDVAASIPQEIHISAEVYGWNRFYRDYIIDSGIAVFNILPKFYTGNSSIHLHEALQAVTTASAARQLHQSGLMVRARSHYTKAIARLNAALDNRASSADDAIVITVFLLSLFETIVPEYLENLLIDTDFQCHIHFRGALVLLRLRAQRAQNSELDQSLLAFFCHICLMSTFLNYGPSDAKWSTLETFASPWANGPLLEPVLRRAVDFRRHFQAQVTTSIGYPSRMELLWMIRNGMAISDELEATAIQVKSSSTNLPSDEPPMAFNNLFHVSTKTTEAITRSSYRAVRYGVVELVANLVSIVCDDGDANGHHCGFQSDVPLERSYLLEAIRGEISAVLSFDSKCADEKDRTGMAYRAYGMFWPILVLLFSTSAGEGKRAWAQDKLRSIGETTGLGLATWAAERINTLQPI